MDPFVRIAQSGGQIIEFIDISDDTDRKYLMITFLPKQDADPDDIDDLLRAFIDTSRVQVHAENYVKCSIEVLKRTHLSIADELDSLYTIEKSILAKYPTVTKDGEYL